MSTIQQKIAIIKEKLTGYNVRNTFPLTDEMLIDRLDVIRELLIQQNKNALNDMFYTSTCCIDVECEGFGCTIGDEFIESGVSLFSSDLPALITGVGNNDIKYLGTIGYGNAYDRSTLANFINNKYSRWTSRRIIYTIVGNKIYYKNIPSGLNKICIVGLFKNPVSLCDYNLRESEYPVPHEYKLELLVVQDILTSMGIFPDELNDMRHQLKALRQGKEVPIESQEQQQEQQ
jgi:hypothetical protein